MARPNPVDLSKADIKEMVVQLAKDARVLSACGEYKAAAEAVDQASLYAADAGMDVRFYRGLRAIAAKFPVEIKTPYLGNPGRGKKDVKGGGKKKSTKRSGKSKNPGMGQIMRDAMK